ncbi:hypothetical protein GCM10027423_52420 [Spirosoma arcticum]
MLTLLLLGTIWAKGSTVDKTVTITHVKKGEQPQAVLDALRKDFANTTIKDTAFLPGTLYGMEWSVQ